MYYFISLEGRLLFNYQTIWVQLGFNVYNSTMILYRRIYLLSPLNLQLMRLYKLIFGLLAFLPFLGIAQLHTYVSGKVIDENDAPLQGVTIQMLNKAKSTTTDSNGIFKMSISPNKPFALIFSSIGHTTVQKSFIVGAGKNEKVIIRLMPTVRQLKDVVITNSSTRRESGSVSIDASKTNLNPSPLNNVESLIKVFVGSNNELTSQYTVRGGNYDENLIYVNDFEIFKPYLISSGQQEGLSFINPAMTGGIKFYTGGYQSKYGDKLSSVLDITYRKPTKFGMDVYTGLLEQGLHLEGTANKNKITYEFGVRNRTNRNLVSSQETQGNYVPSSSDLQSLITWQASNKWELELLANLSGTKFTFFPQSSQLTSGVFSSLYSEQVGLNIYFSGQERDQYSTDFIGLSATQKVNKRLKLKWMLSSFTDHEQQNEDITGAYLFGDVDNTQGSKTQGQIVNPLGSGVYQNFSRDNLQINVLNASHKGNLELGKNFIQWGASIEQQKVTDNIDEWALNDSAGYTNFPSVLKAADNLNITRFSGYAQDNVQFKNTSDVVMQYGVRYNYNTLNHEFLTSPRVGLSFKPKKSKKDIIYKASAGIYQQPPFYREMRGYNGTLNTNLLAQKSWQVTVGLDNNFKLFNRPARFTSEAYYKSMWDVDPYDINDVRLQYFGTNNAKAYSVGIENRLYTELVPDAESWISFNVMQSKEKIDNFYYYQYQNAQGQTITPTTKNQVVADSVQTNVGWLRRPSDRRFTFGMFFQDYMPNNKNLKFYLNMLYGSNLPYNIPGSVKYRDALIIPSYIRMDMGFSALLVDGQHGKLRSHSPFRKFQSIWGTLEVFNFIDHANTISYLLIKDFQNSTFAIPNTLTPRLLNVKIIAKL